MRVWRVKCEMFGEYVLVKEFRSRQEAERYAKRQELLGAWDNVTMYEYDNKGEIWKNERKKK